MSKTQGNIKKPLNYGIYAINFTSDKFRHISNVLIESMKSRKRRCIAAIDYCEIICSLQDQGIQCKDKCCREALEKLVINKIISCIDDCIKETKHITYHLFCEREDFDILKEWEDSGECCCVPKSKKYKGNGTCTETSLQSSLKRKFKKGSNNRDVDSTNIRLDASRNKMKKKDCALGEVPLVRMDRKPWNKVKPASEMEEELEYIEDNPFHSPAVELYIALIGNCNPEIYIELARRKIPIRSVIYITPIEVKDEALKEVVSDNTNIALDILRSHDLFKDVGISIYPLKPLSKSMAREQTTQIYQKISSLLYDQETMRTDHQSYLFHSKCIRTEELYPKMWKTAYRKFNGKQPVKGRRRTRKQTLLKSLASLPVDSSSSLSSLSISLLSDSSSSVTVSETKPSLKQISSTKPEKPTKKKISYQDQMICDTFIAVLQFFNKLFDEFPDNDVKPKKDDNVDVNKETFIVEKRILKMEDTQNQSPRTTKVPLLRNSRRYMTIEEDDILLKTLIMAEINPKYTYQSILEKFLKNCTLKLAQSAKGSLQISENSVMGFHDASTTYLHYFIMDNRGVADHCQPLSGAAMAQWYQILLNNYDTLHCRTKLRSFNCNITLLVCRLNYFEHSDEFVIPTRTYFRDFTFFVNKEIQPWLNQKTFLEKERCENFIDSLKFYRTIEDEDFYVQCSMKYMENECKVCTDSFASNQELQTEQRGLLEKEDTQKNYDFSAPLPIPQFTLYDTSNNRMQLNSTDGVYRSAFIALYLSRNTWFMGQSRLSIKLLSYNTAVHYHRLKPFCAYSEEDFPTKSNTCFPDKTESGNYHGKEVDEDDIQKSFRIWTKDDISLVVENLEKTVIISSNNEQPQQEEFNKNENLDNSDAHDDAKYEETSNNGRNIEKNAEIKKYLNSFMTYPHCLCIKMVFDYTNNKIEYIDQYYCKEYLEKRRIYYPDGSLLIIYPPDEEASGEDNNNLKCEILRPDGTIYRTVFLENIDRISREQKFSMVEVEADKDGGDDDLENWEENSKLESFPYEYELKYITRFRHILDSKNFYLIAKTGCRYIIKDGKIDARDEQLVILKKMNFKKNEFIIEREDGYKLAHGNGYTKVYFEENKNFFKSVDSKDIPEIMKMYTVSDIEETPTVSLDENVEPNSNAHHIYHEDFATVHFDENQVVIFCPGKLTITYDETGLHTTEIDNLFTLHCNLDKYEILFRDDNCRKFISTPGYNVTPHLTERVKCTFYPKPYNNLLFEMLDEDNYVRVTDDFQWKVNRIVMRPHNYRLSHPQFCEIIIEDDMEGFQLYPKVAIQNYVDEIEDSDVVIDVTDNSVTILKPLKTYREIYRTKIAELDEFQENFKTIDFENPAKQKPLPEKSIMTVKAFYLLDRYMEAMLASTVDLVQFKISAAKISSSYRMDSSLHGHLPQNPNVHFILREAAEKVLVTQKEKLTLMKFCERKSALSFTYNDYVEHSKRKRVLENLLYNDVFPKYFHFISETGVINGLKLSELQKQFRKEMCSPSRPCIFESFGVKRKAAKKINEVGAQDEATRKIEQDIYVKRLRNNIKLGKANLIKKTSDEDLVHEMKKSHYKYKHLKT